MIDTEWGGRRRRWECEGRVGSHQYRIFSFEEIEKSQLVLGSFPS